MAKLWNKLRLRQKLLLSYMLVFVVAMTALSGYVLYASRKYVYENNKSALTGMAAKAGANFSMKLEQYGQAISMCAYQEELQTIYANRYVNYYDLYIKLSNFVVPFFTGVRGSYADEVSLLHLYSTSGLNTYGFFVRSADSVKDEPRFLLGMRENGIRWHMGEGVLYASCRVDPVTTLLGREPLGLVYFEVNTPIFMSRYAQIDWPEYDMIVRDAEGNALYQTGAGRGAAGKALPLSCEILAAGWTLEYRVPEETLYGDGFTLAAGSALVLIVSAGVLLLLIIAFSQTLLSGLKALQKGMARVREGDLNVNMRSDSMDEIGALTNAFDDMLSRIRALIEQTKVSERRMADLEYRSLRTQIDPHFLYNTLSFIRWKCLKAGQEDVSRVVEQLSMFYRTCLNKGNDLTDVASEISNVRAYAEIQKQLHDNSFDISFDIPEALLSRKMPCFVLQPLLENAILHGVDPLRDRRGVIRVSLREEGGDLVFRVTDNGRGIADASLEKIREPGRSCGISNVHERIVLCTGEKYGYSARNLPVGCEATLTLPAYYRQIT